MMAAELHEPGMKPWIVDLNDVPFEERHTDWGHALVMLAPDKAGKLLRKFSVSR